MKSPPLRIAGFFWRNATSGGYASEDAMLARCLYNATWLVQARDIFQTLLENEIIADTEFCKLSVTSF